MPSNKKSKSRAYGTYNPPPNVPGYPYYYYPHMGVDPVAPGGMRIANPPTYTYSTPVVPPMVPQPVYTPPAGGAGVNIPVPPYSQGYVPATGSTMFPLNTSYSPPYSYPASWTPKSGPFTSDYGRRYDPGYNANLGVYENPNQPGQWGGWRANPNYDPRDPNSMAYEFTSTGSELNRYGQPAGTPAPVQPRSARRPGSYASGTQPFTPESLIEQYDRTNAYLENWQPRGREESMARASSDRQLAMLKRRKDMLERIARQRGIDLGGEGAGVQTSWVGTIANWRV